MPDKTVYILGAGFSKSAEAPLQSEIIDEIFKLTDDNILALEIDNRHKAQTLLNTFKDFRGSFEKFLENELNLSKNRFKDTTLEDIYSLIDKSIINNMSFRNIPRNELIQLRLQINALIIILMKCKLQSVESLHINKFSNNLVSIRRNNINKDPFTIISTNWDIILENSLLNYIDSQEGILDYCFYLHRYDSGEKLRSGLYYRGQGKYNLKILKLHGSMNWLQCQRCQRVFVTFFQKIALDEFLSKPTCPLCEQQFSITPEKNKGAYLSSVLVMPTFLKDLNIFQLKLTWQIAGIELQEANKIVFMGYSFPLADFDFRHLLGSSIRSDAEIDVVLIDKDRPEQFSHPEFSPEFRYESFFGKRKINFCYDGVKKYINDNFPN